MHFSRLMHPKPRPDGHLIKTLITANQTKQNATPGPHWSMYLPRQAAIIVFFCQFINNKYMSAPHQATLFHFYEFMTI